jgi:transposase
METPSITDSSIADRLVAAERERDSLREALQREMVARADAEQAKESFRKLYESVLLELARLKRQLFGQKAERVDPAQFQLAFGSVLDALARAKEDEEGARARLQEELEKLRKKAQTNSGEARKKAKIPHGRRKLSQENLPVETIVLEPPERKLPGGESLIKIGDEVSEHFERRSASLVIVRVVRPKYKVPEPEVAQTSMPALVAAASETKLDELATPETMPTAEVPARATPTCSPVSAGEATAMSAEGSQRSEGARADSKSELPIAEGPRIDGSIPLEAKCDDSPPDAGEPMRATSPLTPGSILIAAMPERPIPRSNAGPGLLAHVLVQKYEDHIPLHRQERIFRREGLHLPRSTLCGWVEGSTELLSVIVDAMWRDAIEHAAWIAADATGVLVQAAERCKRGHFYVAIAERRHVLFRYTATNDGEAVKAIFAGYKGMLIVDASSVYHELFRQEGGGPAESGCWSHSRRGFFDALSSDRERALTAIGFIGLLYDAHWAATDPKTGLTDGAERRRLASPILDRFFEWIAAERPKVADVSLIAKAMNYVVNQRTALRRFLTDGRLRLDNNISELQLRHQKVGSKNWLFCGSENGARWNTVAVSLIASCRLHAIEPLAYLRDVLTLLPSWKKSQVLELAPYCWQQTRQKPQTQQLLASLRLFGHPDDLHAQKNSAPA